MIQTDHLQYRFVQRVLGIEGKEDIRNHLKRNYYRVYHDIDNAFKKSTLIAENWPRFKNHEQFDCYLFDNRFIFSLDSQSQQGRTVIETRYADNVKQIIRDIHDIHLLIKNVNKSKEDQDLISRKIEWTIKYLEGKTDLQDDLNLRLSVSIAASVDKVKEIKQLKEKRNHLIENIIKRK
ncbi:hypothetical protein [Paenibacillus sp. FSL H3-0333]|uniref:hypothetical protein n=1 Tax=Paenibacillus sp. FSL H3-0333 TaxID=2921373 RepID=UPI0030F77E37